MSLPKIEYSRLVFKRSAQTGVEPTIPTATTIDNTWLATDLLVGEAFLNVADDKMWFRTDNGIIEVGLSGISSDNYYTQSASLSGNVLSFDRNDLADAYSIDLSPILTGATGGGNFLPLLLTASTIVDIDDYTVDFSGGTTSRFEVSNYGGGNLENGILSFSAGTAIFSNDNIDEEVIHTIATIPTQSYIQSNYSGTTYKLNTQKNGMFISSNQLYAAFKGVEYSADYSANFVDRSLVDKGYVDTAISISGGSETAFTGMTGGRIKNIIGTPSVNNASQDSISLFFSTITSGVTGSFAMGSPSYNKAYIGSYSGESSSVNGSFVFGPSRDNNDGSGMNANAAFTLSNNHWIKSGSTSSGLFAGQEHIIGYNQAYSSIIGGSGNTIADDLDNPFGFPYSGFGINSIINSKNCLITSGVSAATIISCIDLTATTSDTVYVPNLSIEGSSIGAPYDLSFAVSDETTAITTGTAKITLRAPRDFQVTKVKVSLTTSGSTTTTVDVNVEGSTILTSPIDLSSGVFVNSTTSITTPTIDEDDVITVDIDVAGTGAAGLKIYLIGRNL
jgi:hypothetical protein